jgi:hypothetical protein
MLFFAGAASSDPTGLILTQAQARQQRARRAELARLASEATAAFFARQSQQGH